MALPEMVDQIISFLDKSNQIKCLRVNSTWHDLALEYVFRDALEGKGIPGFCQRRLDRLLSQPLVQEAFARSSGHVRKLYIEHPELTV